MNNYIFFYFFMFHKAIFGFRRMYSMSIDCIDSFIYLATLKKKTGIGHFCPLILNLGCIILVTFLPQAPVNFLS